MSKNKKYNSPKEKKAERNNSTFSNQLETGLLNESATRFRFFPFPHKIVAYVVLAILSFGIYYNSIWNENALDDGIIIQKNEFVLQGTKIGRAHV